MLSIVIPAYNEEKTIKPVLEKLVSITKDIDEKAEILVVDDGSNDQTGKIVSSVQGVNLLRHPRNKGYGASIKTAIRASRGDWIAIMDADGTYPPEELPKILNARKDYDMVVGHRVAYHASSSFARGVSKILLFSLASYLAGEKIPDLNSGMRVFKKDIALRFFNLFPNGFSFTTTITLACFSNEYSVKYIPIDFKKRVGKSTVKPTEFFNFVALILKIISYFNPLRVFIPASIILLLASIAVFLYSTIVLGHLMDVTVMILFLTSMQVAFMGLLAEIISRK